MMTSIRLPYPLARIDLSTVTVCIHRPRVTTVQRRTSCGSMKADPAARGPEATRASHYPLSYPLRSKEVRDKKPGQTGLPDTERGKGPEHAGKAEAGEIS
jgi:hypothetical protein